MKSQVALVLLLVPLMVGCFGANLSVRQTSANVPCGTGGPMEHLLRTDDGLLIYIQPTTLAVSGDEVLLAGTFNYAHRREPRPARVPMDSLFGAVVSRDGRVTPVLSPIGGRRFRGPRALPRVGGGWDVVFMEIQGSRSARADSVVKLWHGVLDRGRWTSLSEMAIPDSVWLGGTGATELVRAGDTLLWALPGQPALDGTAVVARRVAGAWRTELRPIGSAAYIAMAHHPRHGTRLAVVRGPAAGGSGGAMSLYLEPLDGDASGGERIDPGDLDAHHPSLVSTEEGFMVAWKVDEGEATRRVVARDVMPGTPPGPLREIEASASPFRPPVVVAAPSGIRWVVEHVPGGSARSELRILLGSASDATEIARFENSFYGGRFTAIASAQDELILSGPAYVDSILVSRLQRYRPGCEGMTAAR